MTADLSSDDIVESATWLASNKGFASLIVASATILAAIVMATWWASSVVSAFDKRTTVNEHRLQNVEEAIKSHGNHIQAISDEQLRRTVPVSEIRRMSEILDRVAERVELMD